MEKIKYKKNRSSDGVFTACTARISLLETVTDAAENVVKMATILLSTARSSFDGFQNARKSGQRLCGIVKSISSGKANANPNIRGKMTASLNRRKMNLGKCNFSSRGFLRENHEANHLITQTSEKGRQRANN